MKVSEALRLGEKQLQSAGIGTARLDCLVLLEDSLNTNRTQILADPELELTDEQYTILCIALDKRSLHVPLAYIRKKSEFYGRDFFVDERVLEPRPESETILSQLLWYLEMFRPKSNISTIIDIGTGSGALAITAKLEVPSATVWATDIDQNCLDVAMTNAANFGANVEFAQGNLLEPFQNPKPQIQNPILLCNLPYVPDSFTINTAASHEPRQAIFGGMDGLDFYRRLFAQIAALASKPVLVITESLPTQHHSLATIARKYDFTLDKTDDFIQLFTTTRR